MGSIGLAFLSLGLFFAVVAGFIFTARKSINAAAPAPTAEDRMSPLVALKSPWAVLGALAIFFYVGSEDEAKSLQSYYTTRFFRFLVSLRKITQHATHSTYVWVPIQTWDQVWTDNDLYAKYGITKQERAYIESQVRAMDLGSTTDD